MIRFFRASFVPSLVAAALACSPAWSADQPDCEKIQSECGEAGYTRDLPEGKDLMKKCFQPIMNGQDVAGVKVDSDLVKKCHDEQNQKPARKRRH